MTVLLGLLSSGKRVCFESREPGLFQITFAFVQTLIMICEKTTMLLLWFVWCWWFLLVLVFNFFFPVLPKVKSVCNSEKLLLHPSVTTHLFKGISHQISFRGRTVDCFAFPFGNKY